MKTAKKLFESRMELLMAANDRDTADKDSVYIDYIFEIEQELHDNELRRKDLLTSLQRSNAQKAELEQELAKLKESQTQWISVKDRLPEIDIPILVIIPDVHYSAYAFRANNADEYMVYYISGVKWCNTVTHWMPLPDKPDAL